MIEVVFGYVAKLNAWLIASGRQWASELETVASCFKSKYRHFWFERAANLVIQSRSPESWLKSKLSLQLMWSLSKMASLALAKRWSCWKGTPQWYGFWRTFQQKYNIMSPIWTIITWLALLSETNGSGQKKTPVDIFPLKMKKLLSRLCCCLLDLFSPRFQWMSRWQRRHDCW